MTQQARSKKLKMEIKNKRKQKNRKGTHRRRGIPQKTKNNNNLCILGIDKGEKSQGNGLDQIFNKITEENFSKLREGTHRTPDRQDQKRFSQHITAKTLSIHNKESKLKAPREKNNASHTL